MNEIEDLINRLTQMSWQDKVNPPDTAVLILTRREIMLILKALSANVPSGLVNQTPG